ncbi:unnamed protein product [Mycena citricolor]|uniref:Eukaryotic translation initiation factor 3 subunit M n=1 Tax=Mycena citricolor TaxID=2018698 RepID=A0AAD2GU58_9AGAR|nr:unnamed protein product [Mycena citricolor]
MSSDSVAIFGEGTFEEQIQELVNYVVRSKSEEERPASIRPYQDALKTEEDATPLAEDDERRRKVLLMVLADVQSLGEGSEKEIEGFFNLIYAHLLTLFPADSPDVKTSVTALIKTISSAPVEQATIKYRLLSNLFNTLPRKSPLRLQVYTTILQLATSREELEALQLTRVDVERWLLEWDVSAEEKSSFLKSISEAYRQAQQLPTSYEYSIAYVRSLSAGSPSSETAAVELIATALRLPFVFDFDPLFKLDVVVAAKNHELFGLLHIFLNDSLPAFSAWADAHPAAFETYHLNKSQLARKIRLLTLASLGFKNIGQDLPYSKIAEALQVEASEVEKWVIDVIRAGLLSGKLSQTAQTVRVIRATSRSFEKEQWELLEKRLVAWKTGLAGVLDVVAAARKQAVPSSVLQAQVAA